MLRLAVIAVSLVLTGGAVAHAQVQPQAKLDPRFIAFRDDCVQVLHSLAETQKSIAAAGWVKVDSASRPELKRIYDHQRRLWSYQGVSFDTYSRTVGGRALYMLITGNLPRYYIDGAERMNECAVYDFEDRVFAADPDANGVVENWVGDPPSEKRTIASDVGFKSWDSSSRHPDLEKLIVQSISQSAPKAWVFKGRMWSAQAVVRQ